MKRIFMTIQDSGGCALYRAQLPVKYCAPILAAEGIELVSGVLPADSCYDAIVLHRFLPTEQHANCFANACYNGRQIWYETDDDVWSVPAWNPAGGLNNPQTLGSIQALLAASCRCLVSTEPLASVVRKQLPGGAPVDVLPNLLDPDMWLEPLPKTDDAIRILWSGSIHHSEDINLLVKPLEALLLKSPRVQVIFFGDYPLAMGTWQRQGYGRQGLLIPKWEYGQRVSFVDGVPVQAYPSMLRMLRPDIALAPLTPCPFNESKSNLKWLELSGGAGAALVASKLPPYECIRDREDGILVDGTEPNLWIDALSELVEDGGLRRRLAQRARERVREEFSWTVAAQRGKWLEAFRGVR